MRKKLSIPLGLAIFFIIIPLVNAQVGDQNGIPPTDAIAGFIVNGTEWLGDSYNTTVELVGGDGIEITQNSTSGLILINQTQYSGLGSITYWNQTGTELTISGISDGETNLVKVDVPSEANPINLNFDNGGSDNGRLRYTGEVTTNFVISSIITLSLAAGANQDVIVTVAKNGAAIDDGRIVTVGRNGEIAATGVNAIVELQQNDYVEVFVGNLDATNNIIVHSLNLRALGNTDLEGTQFGFLDSIHTIGNVTNTGCALDEILKVDVTGTFVCATAGAGGSGETNTASNLNDSVFDYGLFESKVGSDLQFKSLLNGSGIVLTQNGTNIMINSTSTRDQIYWTGFQFQYSSSTTWLSMDGEFCASSCSNADYYTAIASKPIYLDYLEVRVMSNTMSAGQWDFRFVELPYASIQASDCTMLFSSFSDGDTYRCEIDANVIPGQEFWLDGECASCVSGNFIVSITLEYYAVNDANDFPGWEFQDDNLGNHTATQNLDVNNHSIQNTSYIEMDGTVAAAGSVRFSSGDAMGWRNAAGTDDNQFGFDGNDAILINIPSGLTQFQFNATDFTINDNQIKGTMGCSDNDLIDYDSATGRWECIDPTTLGGSSFFQTMIWNGDPTLSVVKASTVYLGFGSASSAAEGDVRIPMGEAGTASRLECEVSTSGTNANTQILVRKNSGNTSLQVNYGSAVTGILLDSTNSFTFNQQDRLDIRVINNSGGGGAATIVIQHCSLLVTYD